MPDFFPEKKEGPQKGPSFGWLQFFYVNSPWALGAFFAFEAYCITLGKGLETVALDGAVMDEVLVAIFARYKAKTLGIIEPFHCSFNHLLSSLL